MKAAHLRLLKKRPHWAAISDGRQALLAYTLVMFFYYFGDTIMSYISPIVINSYVSNQVILGLIISTSSMIGLLCDTLFAKIFQHKSYPFFAPLTLLSAILFPISFIFFPHITPTFIFAMAIWGAYYEFARFSHFNFIHAFVKTREHAHAWGILQAFQALALLVAPLLAIFFFDINKFLPFWVAIGFFVISLIGFYWMSWKWKKHVRHHVIESQPPIPATLMQKVKIWHLLIKKIWPIFVFLLILTVLDSSFWTVGTLLSEELRHTSWLGSFLIPAYIFPSIIVTLLAPRLAWRFGKKRVSFITAIIGSLILLAGGLIFPGGGFVIVVLLSSLFIEVSYPEIYAVFEDYVARLGVFGNDMVGLEGAAISLGFIAGPILAGILASFLGNQNAIVCFAGLFGLTAVLALSKVPRKIKMPQQELLEITIAKK